MKKYFFKSQSQVNNYQRSIYLDLQDKTGSIWRDKVFFQTLDAILRKRFENVEDISSIAYYEQDKKEDWDSAELNQFLEKRQEMLSLLETNEGQKKYIFILRLLLVSLATKNLPRITDKTIALAIVERAKTLYQSLYDGMSSKITLNKTFLSRWARLCFSLPKVPEYILFPNHAIVVTTYRERGRRVPSPDENTGELTGMCAIRAPSPDENTSELTSMCETWSETDQQVGEASASRSSPSNDVVPGVSSGRASFFQQQEVIAHRSESQVRVAETESIEKKTKTLIEIRCLLKDKLMVSQPECASSNSRCLEELLSQGSVLKIAFRIIKQGLALNKEQKFQVDKLDEAIRQLQMLFEAEPMEGYCEQIGEICSILNISVRIPSVRFLGLTPKI